MSDLKKKEDAAKHTCFLKKVIFLFSYVRLIF